MEERKSKSKKVGISLATGRESKVGTRVRRERGDTRRAALLTCYRHKWEVRAAARDRERESK